MKPDGDSVDVRKFYPDLKKISPAQLLRLVEDAVDFAHVCFLFSQ